MKISLSLKSRAEELIVRQLDSRWLKAPNYSAELKKTVQQLSGVKDGWKLARRLEAIRVPEPDPGLPSIPSAREIPD